MTRLVYKLEYGSEIKAQGLDKGTYVDDYSIRSQLCTLQSPGELLKILNKIQCLSHSSHISDVQEPHLSPGYRINSTDTECFKMEDVINSIQ